MKKIDSLITQLETTYPVAEQMMGFKLNYSPQSLKKMEDAIVKMYPGRKELPPTIRTMFAAYLGQTLVKNNKNARWVDFDEYVDQAYIVVKSTSGSDIKAYPFARVDKFFADNSNSIYGFYCMLQDIGLGRLSIDQSEIVSGKEMKGMSPRGYEWKVTAIPKHLAKRYENGEISKDEMFRLAKEEER